MSYASILVHVDSSAVADARIALAADLARRFGALLIGVAAAAPRPPPADAFGGVALAGEVFEATMEAIGHDLAGAEEAFRMRDDLEGLAIDFRRAVERPIVVVARESRAADLLVVGRDVAPGDPDASAAIDPGDVAMAAGRPVLVVPTGARACAARRIVVGWKDTREARRALSDASPFLRAAEEVRIAAIVEKGDLPSARAALDDVLRHCARHGVKACGVARALVGETVADDLVLEAVEAGADLLVAGAWGHTRLREWAFGGVTRTLLARAPVPVLLSH